MKNLITTIGAMLIFTMFLMQYAANHQTYIRMAGMENALSKTMRDAGRGEADFTELKEKLSAIAGCREYEVNLTVDEEARKYRLELPLYGVVGASDLVGISAEENRQIYRKEGVF